MTKSLTDKLTTLVYLSLFAIMISFYSPQMVAAVNTTKYTIENDLTKKEKRKNKHTYKQTARTYLNQNIL